MTKATQNALRTRLQDELGELQADILYCLNQAKGVDNAKIINKLSQHAISHWPELLRAYLTPELDQKSHRLELIQAALSQMDMGLYGLCSDCDQKIARELLLIDPARQRCEVCERRFVQQKHMYL